MIKFTTGFCALITVILCLEASQTAKADEGVETLQDPKANAENRMPRGAVTTLHAAGLLFASFDSNGDYTVDTAEFIAGRDASFARADQTGNGSLSLIELQDWRALALGSLDAAPSNMAFDRDFDQTVSYPEFDEMFGSIFQAKDTDADGRVAFSELIRVIEIPDRRRAEGADRPERGSGGKGRGGRGKRPGG